MTATFVYGLTVFFKAKRRFLFFSAILLIMQRLQLLALHPQLLFRCKQFYRKYKGSPLPVQDYRPLQGAGP